MSTFEHIYSEIRAEDKLLLLCIQPGLDASSKNNILALAQQNISWDYLIQRAKQHKVAQLFYVQLNAIAPEIIPLNIHAQLKQNFNSIALHNLKLTANLIKLMDKFKQANITLIPYKGPALAAIAYGDIALRTFCDLDFFVEVKDLAKASAVLIAEGFVADCEAVDLEDSFFLKWNQETGFYNKTTKVAIDLHWKINYFLNSKSLDPNSSFDQLEKITIDSHELVNFSREKMFVILNLHAAMHCWESLSLLCDIAALMHRQNHIQWQVVINKAKELGVSKLFCINFLLLNKLWGIEIPAAVLSGMNFKQQSLNYANTLLNNLFLKKDFRTDVWNHLFIFMPKRRDKLWQGYQDLLTFILAPKTTDLQQFRLPKYLFPLYFILRPFLIMIRKSR